jgi:transposase
MMDVLLLEPSEVSESPCLRRLLSELREEIAGLRQEVSVLRCEVGYWKSRHADAVQRNVKLEQELVAARAEIRQLKADRFGKQSEKLDRSNQLDEAAAADAPPPKRRGQQPHRRGPARRDYSHLPVKETFLELPPESRVCDGCGKPLEDLGDTEDSEQVEVEINVFRRRYRRRRYRRTCDCPGPRTLTAPTVNIRRSRECWEAQR